MTSLRIEHRLCGDTLRKLHRAALLLVPVALTAVFAGPTAAANTASVAIASPRANQSVKGMLQIMPRVKSKRGPFTVTVRVDGKFYDKQRSSTRRDAQRGIPIDTTELKNGRHQLTVTVYGKAKPRRASQTLKFVVRNSKRRPAGSGERAPSGNLKDFRLIVAEGFDRDAPPGSIPDNIEDPETPVYTGSTGTPWMTYPSTFLDTFLRNPYRPKEVLSVHDSVLDFYLHPVNGKNAGASVSPILPNGTQYQTYGRYSVRMRIGNSPLSQYHVAFLLWPYDNKDYEVSESDFPENQLVRGRTPATGYAHYGKDSTQEYIFSKPVDFRDWHTYTQEWKPGERRFYLDGKLVYVTKAPVWGGPMRWQLQVQSFKNGKQRGRLYIDWAAVWSYAPGTKAG